MKRRIEIFLNEWKNSPDRKPLVLSGARQVGKTYSLLAFGREYYDNVVHINLDVNGIVRGYFEEDIAPARIIQMLEGEIHETILPEKTLIILDEIQASERALTSLKYFCEDAPEYHIAAAGSLLGVAINRDKYSFPVGKVQSATMYPLDFEEYLIARGEDYLSEEIRNHYEIAGRMPVSLHEKAIRLYREYLILGGMPVSISAYISGKKLIEIPAIQQEIMDNYIADMTKYASTSESVRIRACYNSIPAQLGKENSKFQYKVVQKGGTATHFGEAIDWLEQAGVVQKCLRTNRGETPIAAYEDLSSFKLYMADVGILAMKSGIQQSVILSNVHNIFAGALIENYVAQQLTALGFKLHYWRSAHAAELDFLVEHQGEILAIEVKRSEHTKSRSLSVFKDTYRPDRAVKLSLKNFGYADGVFSVPLYATHCIDKAPAQAIPRK